jgi:hypothetical protein
MIDVTKQYERTGQQAALAQDNANKTTFALDLIARMPKEPPRAEEPPKIPSLGALAIPS